MDSESLASRLSELGFRPGVISAAGLAAVEARTGPLPPTVRALLERFGGSASLEGVVYQEADGTEALLGWIVDEAELLDALDALDEGLVPLVNDGGDNRLCVRVPSGEVVFVPHDAPDRQRRVAGSIEALLAGLRLGD